MPIFFMINFIIRWKCYRFSWFSRCQIVPFSSRLRCRRLCIFINPLIFDIFRLFWWFFSSSFFGGCFCCFFTFFSLPPAQFLFCWSFCFTYRFSRCGFCWRLNWCCISFYFPSGWFWWFFSWFLKWKKSLELLWLIINAIWKLLMAGRTIAESNFRCVCVLRQICFPSWSEANYTRFQKKAPVLQT